MSLFFANPICGGQDPFVCKGPDGLYYSVAESRDSRQIEVFCSRRLTDRGNRRTAFEAFPSGPSSADLWAPELWRLRGKWYIYYAGSSAPGQENWETHRVFVLEADEPMGPYRFVGQLDLGDYMSIDGTVMELSDGRLFFFYVRNCEGINCIYAAEMDSPTKIKAEPVLISKPEYPWEGTINEGPFPVIRNGNVHLMYSANAAHLPQYCIAMLRCKDTERILDAKSWEKYPRPVLSAEKDIYGPGHACIVRSPDDSEDWLVFHSKFDLDCSLPGGWNRSVNLLRLNWDEDGCPLPEPLKARGEAVKAPSGEEPSERGGRLSLTSENMEDNMQEMSYYRKKTVFYGDDGMEILGSVFPDYGDKAFVRGRCWGNFEAEATVQSNGAAGILFRVNLPAVGAYNWQGYGAYTDGDKWYLLRCKDGRQQRLAEGGTETGPHILKIRAEGEKITFFIDGRACCEVTDAEGFREGMIGFGALGGDALFRDLTVEPSEADIQVSCVSSTQGEAKPIY